MTQNRIEPIDDSKKTIAAIVQDRIRDAILGGNLAAGSRIDQAQLANDLNVSLVPVREALKKLEAEGFVQIIPRRGAFVTQTSVADMEDLYFARTILEGQAAYHAAEHLTDADLTALKVQFDDMGRALEHHDFGRFMTCNRAFHLIIYNAAGSRYLTNMITSLWELAERYRFRYVYMSDQAPIIQDEHRQILDACLARNKTQLRDAIAFHMNQTLLGVKSYIQSRQAEAQAGKAT